MMFLGSIERTGARRARRLSGLVVVLAALLLGHTALASAASNSFLSTTTQAMEGDLKVPQGSTLSVGYSFTMPGSHPQATVGLAGGAVTLTATCASGTPGAQTLPVSIPDRTYVDPAGSSAWYPTGNQSSPAAYQGSVTVPSFCDPGVLVRFQQGGTFSTWVTSTDTADSVNVRWHYSDATSGSWSGTYTVIPGSPTTTTLQSSPSTSSPGQVVTFTASVSGNPASGTVAFTSNGNPIEGCSNVPVSVAGQATCSTSFDASGTDSITAAYSGAGGFGPSSGTFSQTVLQGLPAT